MGVMRKSGLNRLDVLARLDSDRLTARAAAELMAITPRQTYRLLRRYRDGGASAITNRRSGRPSNNRLPDVVRDHAIALVRETPSVLARLSAAMCTASALFINSRVCLAVEGPLTAQGPSPA